MCCKCNFSINGNETCRPYHIVAPLGQDSNNAKPHFQGLTALETAFRPYRTGSKTTFIEKLLANQYNQKNNA